MTRLLLVEDDASVRSTLSTFLELEGFQVEAAASSEAAFQKLASEPFPLVLSDIYLDSRTGLDILEEAKRRNPNCMVVLMTGRGSMETVVAATRGGAFDYVAKPFDLDDILSVLRRAIAVRDADDAIAEEDDLPESEMIGSSAPMVEVYKTLSRVAPTDSTVLIEGETGTGKEVVARLIHRNSSRAAMPFEPVDCGSVASTLLESELFGALRGSYTGADRDRIGLLEAANKGTAFLDEVGDIEPGFQLKLLRFLQEREIRPLGASKARKVDVRVIAASNKNLDGLVREGKFREDLYFRLNVVRIELPPLRTRRGDVMLLAHFFLNKYNARYDTETRFHPSAVPVLESFAWPGNVRQLQHLIERLTILAEDKRIRAEDVDRALRHPVEASSTSESLADKEAEQIQRVLQATAGNKAKAARILGIERKTLYRKLAKI
ncbi:MAG: sigma-54-dependent Fis family transcriptional regulator [Bryobacterales bacterium]|nr:sigma-54-dependent Fis family transcriptional regulator [Bryobacterales bacterium]